MSGQSLKELTVEKTAEDEMLPAVKVPRKYKVILLNDDYTPMDFVVTVLKSFFYLPEEVATQIMLEIHIQGKGVCGVFTRDVAETKVSQVNHFARCNEHPLLCVMELE